MEAGARREAPAFFAAFKATSDLGIQGEKP
jgi:hypothetical protein